MFLDDICNLTPFDASRQSPSLPSLQQRYQTQSAFLRTIIHEDFFLKLKDLTDEIQIL